VKVKFGTPREVIGIDGYGMEGFGELVDHLGHERAWELFENLHGLFHAFHGEVFHMEVAKMDRRYHAVSGDYSCGSVE